MEGPSRQGLHSLLVLVRRTKSKVAFSKDSMTISASSHHQRHNPEHQIMKDPRSKIQDPSPRFSFFASPCHHPLDRLYLSVLDQHPYALPHLATPSIKLNLLYSEIPTALRALEVRTNVSRSDQPVRQYAAKSAINKPSGASRESFVGNMSLSITRVC